MFLGRYQIALKELTFVGSKAKGWISKRVFQEIKAHQMENTCATDVFHLACFVFLKYPFSDSPFCLITDHLVEALTLDSLKLIFLTTFLSLIFCNPWKATILYTTFLQKWLCRSCDLILSCHCKLVLEAA